ncbi:MAG: hypothetical protein J6T79_05915 [Verrucomicrobia bacterium]|nr:hypothetical protein [Verrucomicrobiota bacterium]
MSGGKNRSSVFCSIESKGIEMTLRFVRWFRRIFALVFFTAISVQFLDVYHQLPDVWYMYHPT